MAAATYLILKIPNEILGIAHDAVSKGNSYTIHVEMQFGNQEEYELDAIPIKTEIPIEIPQKEIDSIATGKPLTKEDLEAARAKRENGNH